MSAEHHAHSDAHAEAGEEAHEAHYEEPLPPEPESPPWLPLLGAGLFLLGFLAFVFTREPEAAQNAEAVASAAPAPAPVPSAVRPRAPMPSRVLPQRLRDRADGLAPRPAASP